MTEVATPISTNSRLVVSKRLTLALNLSLDCSGFVLRILNLDAGQSAVTLMASFGLGREKFRRLTNEAIDNGFAIPDDRSAIFTDEPFEINKRSRLVTGIGGIKGAIPDTLRWLVWERDDFRCCTCGSRTFLTVDHIVPEARGGTLRLDNLRTLCRSCNSRKGAR